MEKNQSPNPKTDRYHVIPGCACHPPARGHLFEAYDLFCQCGKSFMSNSDEPTICPLNADKIRQWLANPENRNAFLKAQNRIARHGR